MGENTKHKKIQPHYLQNIVWTKLVERNKISSQSVRYNKVIFAENITASFDVINTQNLLDFLTYYREKIVSKLNFSMDFALVEKKLALIIGSDQYRLFSLRKDGVIIAMLILKITKKQISINYKVVERTKVERLSVSDLVDYSLQSFAIQNSIPTMCFGMDALPYIEHADHSKLGLLYSKLCDGYTPRQLRSTNIFIDPEYVPDFAEGEQLAVFFSVEQDILAMEVHTNDDCWLEQHMIQAIVKKVKALGIATIVHND
jgi:hypothetical protein